VPSRFQFYDSEVVDLALLAIFWQILSTGSSAVHLANAIAQIEHQHIISIFSRVIRLWIECIQIQVQINLTSQSHAGCFRNSNLNQGTSLDMVFSVISNENFYGREKHRLFRRASNRDSGLYNIIRFFTMAARRHRTIRFCMLDAGALSLVIIAFINTDFFTPRLINFTRMQSKWAKAEPPVAESTYNQDRSPMPIPADILLADASELSLLMPLPAFRATWHQQQLAHRRHLCSLLLDQLLGDTGETDDRYAWMKALFSKILA
jgi:hypothetical protein